jgi:hypothetical protein
MAIQVAAHANTAMRHIEISGIQNVPLPIGRLGGKPSLARRVAFTIAFPVVPGRETKLGGIQHRVCGASGF